MEGHVYILVNSSFPNLVKIGRTIKSPNIRAQELSSTGTPGKFIVAYSVLVNNCIEIESEMHALFSEQRHTNDREFFDIGSAVAIDKLIEITKNKKINSNTNLTLTPQSGMATIYLAKIQNIRKIFRIGLINNSSEFLSTSEFNNSLFDLYQAYDKNFISIDIEILGYEEFQNIDNDGFFDMKNIIVKNLMRLKKMNSSIFYLDEYDDRTLFYRLMKEPTPQIIFKSTLSLVIPIAKANSQRTFSKNKDLEYKSHLAKIDNLKKINI